MLIRSTPRHDRRRVLSALLLLGVFACDAREDAQEGPPPVEGPPLNFVLVLADDLGWADVGYQGSTFHRTPNIDRLARDGLVFTQAYAAAPVCTPARAALFTGLAPARLHVTRAMSAGMLFGEPEEIEDGEVQKDMWEPRVGTGIPAVPTLATHLRARGYRTTFIGKWHLEPGPLENGFERALASSGSGMAQSQFSPYGIEGFEDGPRGEYLTRRLTKEAIRALEEPSDEPFFLVLSHYVPHKPYQAPMSVVEEFKARVDANADQRNPTYAAMVQELDVSLGRIRDALERLGLARNTLLVFTSDNGGFEGPIDRTNNEVKKRITSNAPLRSGKGRLYEGGLRVPLILWGGTLARTGTCDVPVIGMDLCPTLLARAGAQTQDAFDGVDLSPLLAPGGTLAPRALYFHFPHQSFASALRQGNWKLYYSWRQERSELYDLATDLGEAHDLAASRPELTGRLQAQLFDWLDAVDAHRPTRNPSPDPDAPLPERRRPERVGLRTGVSRGEHADEPSRTGAERTPPRPGPGRRSKQGQRPAPESDPPPRAER